MELPTPTGQEGSGHESASPAFRTRRRKVRKGTRSCWECKRRKIRCIFVPVDHGSCVGCDSRRVPCVSQDMPEELAPARHGGRHLGDRITRVENLMKGLVSSGTPVTHAGAAAFRLADFDTNLTHVSAQSPLRSQSSSLLTPDSHEPCSPYLAGPRTEVHHLLAVFPNDQEARELLRASSRTLLYTHLTNTQPHSRLNLETLTSHYPDAVLPSSETHPVLLARWMLIFALTLQSPSGEEVSVLSEPPSMLERRLVVAATKWVTTNEEMHGTIECLICIMLEGVYEMNCGNLRRAWVVFRRAMTVAQLMGLHRSPMPPLKRIDPQLDAEPEFMWFRIVYMDRYLSLLLGLPQGTSDKSIASIVAAQEPHLGQFERQLTVTACRILERNASDASIAERTTTQSIDSELLSASKSMPSSFWRAADFRDLEPGSPETLLETLRLSAQVYYYGQLVQLHLPFMLRSSQTADDEYSRVTCVNASREIMVRFIAHRTFNPRSSCSRPVDFFALLAAMTLLLAYLDSHHRRQPANLLAHQRMSDRAILQQALETMDAVNHVNKDIITEESAKLIRNLMDLEAQAAETHARYTTSQVSKDDETQAQSVGELRLYIPYLGTFKIAKQGPDPLEPASHRTDPIDLLRSGCGEFNILMQARSVAQNPSLQESPSQEPMSEPADMENVDYSMDLQPNAATPTPPVAAGIDDWAFQGVDLAFFDSLMKSTSCPEDSHLQ